MAQIQSSWELPYAIDTTQKNQTKDQGVPVVVTVEVNPTRNLEAAGSIPGLAQWVKDLALPGAVVEGADAAQI